MQQLTPCPLLKRSSGIRRKIPAVHWAKGAHTLAIGPKQESRQQSSNVQRREPHMKKPLTSGKTRDSWKFPPSWCSKESIIYHYWKHVVWGSYPRCFLLWRWVRVAIMIELIEAKAFWGGNVFHWHPEKKKQYKSNCLGSRWLKTFGPWHRSGFRVTWTKPSDVQLDPWIFDQLTS